MSYELVIRTPRYLTDDEAQEINDLVREMLDSDPICDDCLAEMADEAARAEIFAKLDMVEQQLDEIAEELNELED